MNTNDQEDIYLEVDASSFSIRPAEGIALKRCEEYLEKLKQYAPAEYEAAMKQREELQQKKIVDGNRSD